MNGPFCAYKAKTKNVRRFGAGRRGSDHAQNENQKADNQNRRKQLKQGPENLITKLLHSSYIGFVIIGQ